MHDGGMRDDVLVHRDRRGAVCLLLNGNGAAADADGEPSRPLVVRASDAPLDEGHKLSPIS
jgi:hypothetical protein